LTVRVGILTVSDRSARGERTDSTGPLLRQIAERQGWMVEREGIVPDELLSIQTMLAGWTDDARLDLILTTGGTGFAPRDMTPEATRGVIEREAPGLAEAMRTASLRTTVHAMLSRAVCGIRGRTLIINMPGSPQAARENLETVLPALPHAVALLQESPDSEHGHRLAAA
jgi:molybdenum cofactor synthesis domain-containing protein